MQLRRNTLGSQSTENSVKSAPEEWADFERRDGDRRDRPTRPWNGIFGPLRRARGRRVEDRAVYVDRYSRRDVALILAVFILNVGDAFFTMLWLERGGQEANPVMDFFLDIGPGAFLLQKCIVVGIWLVVLLVHKNFRFARIGIYISLAAYAALMFVHFGIIASGIDPPPIRSDSDARPVLEAPSPQFEASKGMLSPAADPTPQLSQRGDPPTGE